MYRTGLIPSYLFNHPDAIAEILVTKHDYLVKSQLGSIAKPLLGNGLLLSEGGSWKQQQHLIQPAFHHKRIATHAQIMVDYAAKMLHTWKHGEVRNIYQEMMELTLSIAARTFFGSDLQSGLAVIN